MPRLPAEAYPRGVMFPFMLEQEWVHDGAWELPKADFTAFGALAESLGGLATQVADAALDDDRVLDRLGLAAQATMMRSARERGERPVVSRLDFALAAADAGGWTPHLLELNGDTPGNLFEGAVLQREWGRWVGAATAGDGLEPALVAGLARLGGPLAVLHHPGDPYIVSQARYLASLVEGARRIEYPAVPDGRHEIVYKMFRWGRLWAGRFPEVGEWAKRRGSGIYEPANGVLLQHKGLLAMLWDAAPHTPGLLPATLNGSADLPDGGANGWAEKSFHGVSGEEVRVVMPGSAPSQLRAGHVWQARVPMHPVDGIYPVLCAVLVDGRFAGALMREDDTAISQDDMVAPIAVVD